MGTINQHLQEITDKITLAAQRLELLPLNEMLIFKPGKASQGIPWELEVRKIDSREHVGVRSLDFMPHNRKLGDSRKEAILRLRAVAAALTAADQSMQVVWEREQKAIEDMVNSPGDPPF